MKQLALVGLDDADVDLLVRLRQRDDLKLEAVYHSDPEALVMRLAGLARLPVVLDVSALAALDLDLCVSGGGAAAILKELQGRAQMSGRPVPLTVPIHEIEEFLSDPDGYAARGSTRPSKPAETPPAPSAAVETDDAPDEPAVPETTVDHDIPREEPTPVTRKETAPPRPEAAETATPESAAPAAPSPAAAEPEARKTATATATNAATEEEDDEDLEARVESLGSPTIEMFYEPVRLGTWLTEAACRTAGGSAAVLWRRDADGQRYTLVAYAPNSDSLPTIPFPPSQLDEFVRAGRVQVVAPEHFVAPETTPPPFHFLAVPLPGQSLSYALLGVFRPVENGDFPRAAITELSARAAELGLAVERCFQFARMGQELKGLRFKEKVRDLMLESGIPESERWSRLLRFLLEEVPADFGQFYRLSPDGLRLSLEAISSQAGEFEGWVSIPVGRGIIGAAMERERLSVYSADDGDPRGMYLLPIRSKRIEGTTPIGVVVLDGAQERTAGGEETASLLETMAGIMAPLLSGAPSQARS